MIARARLLVVVGLQHEAVIASGPVHRVLVGTAGLDEALKGVAAVISFGLCGGLSHTLAAGDLIIGAGEGCDSAWSEALRSKLAAARLGRILGSDRPVAGVTDKARLGAATGALAVDMETHLVKAAARESRLPCAVLRAVCDPLGRHLPRAALAGFRPNGRTNLAAVLAALARRPSELPALLAVARDSSRGLRALRNARHLLGPGLACPYLG